MWGFFFSFGFKHLTKCKSQGAQGGSVGLALALALLAAASSFDCPRSLGMSGSASSDINSVIYTLNLAQIPFLAGAFLCLLRGSGASSTTGAPALIE
jgi:hypothetical protein